MFSAAKHSLYLYFTKPASGMKLASSLLIRSIELWILRAPVEVQLSHSALIADLTRIQHFRNSFQIGTVTILKFRNGT